VIEADETDGALTRRPAKSEAAFRTISEVSSDLDVPQHVLRFWESKFNQIKPLKRGGGRRYYRPEDLQLLKRIRDLLYKDGYTIRGVQKLLREQTRNPAGGEAKTGAPGPKTQPDLAAAQADLLVEPPPVDRVTDPRAELLALLDELEELRDFLRGTLQ
jgi:DNA-binding transcriptional MerR regulator